ncbi:hypothetical protein [Halomonas sp. WWR20]
MAIISLSFEGVKTLDDVNRVTAALMMIEGVDSAEVDRHGAEVEGQVRPEVLINKVESLGFKARR